MIAAPKLTQTRHSDAPAFSTTPKHPGESGIYILCGCLQVFLTGNITEISFWGALRRIFRVQLIIGWVLQPRAEWNRL